MNLRLVVLAIRFVGQGLPHPNGWAGRCCFSLPLAPQKAEKYSYHQKTSHEQKGSLYAGDKGARRAGRDGVQAGLNPHGAHRDFIHQRVDEVMESLVASLLGG